MKLETSARGFDKDLYGLNLQKFDPAGSPLSAKRRHVNSSCPRKLLALACGLFLGIALFLPAWWIIAFGIDEPAFFDYLVVSCPSRVGGDPERLLFFERFWRCLREQIIVVSFGSMTPAKRLCWPGGFIPTAITGIWSLSTSATEKV